MFQNVSDEVTAEAAGKDLSDVADSSCTSGYDNDGEHEIRDLRERIPARAEGGRSARLRPYFGMGDKP